MFNQTQVKTRESDPNISSLLCKGVFSFSAALALKQGTFGSAQRGLVLEQFQIASKIHSDNENNRNSSIPSDKTNLPKQRLLSCDMKDEGRFKSAEHRHYKNAQPQRALDRYFRNGNKEKYSQFKNAMLNNMVSLDNVFPYDNNSGTQSNRSNESYREQIQHTMFQSVARVKHSRHTHSLEKRGPIGMPGIHKEFAVNEVLYQPDKNMKKVSSKAKEELVIDYLDSDTEDEKKQNEIQGSGVVEKPENVKPIQENPASNNENKLVEKTQSENELPVPVKKLTNPIKTNEKKLESPKSTDSTSGVATYKIQVSEIKEQSNLNENLETSGNDLKHRDSDKMLLDPNDDKASKSLFADQKEVMNSSEKLSRNEPIGSVNHKELIDTIDKIKKRLSGQNSENNITSENKVIPKDEFAYFSNKNIENNKETPEINPDVILGVPCDGVNNPSVNENSNVLDDSSHHQLTFGKSAQKEDSKINKFNKRHYSNRKRKTKYFNIAGKKLNSKNQSPKNENFDINQEASPTKELNKNLDNQVKKIEISNQNNTENVIIPMDKEKQNIVENFQIESPDKLIQDKQNESQLNIDNSTRIITMPQKANDSRNSIISNESLKRKRLYASFMRKQKPKAKKEVSDCLTLIGIMTSLMFLTASLAYFALGIVSAFDKKGKEAYFLHDPTERTLQSAAFYRQQKKTIRVKTDDWGYFQRTYYEDDGRYSEYNVFLWILLTSSFAGFIWLASGILEVYKFVYTKWGLSCWTLCLDIIGLVLFIPGNAIILPRICIFYNW